MLSDWPAEYYKPREPVEGECHSSALETQSPTDAILLTRQLGARGIAAWIEKDDVPRDPAGMSRCHRRVMVWSGDVADATKVIDRFRRAL